MHLYWRVIEELKYLNEIWTMKDPSLARCFNQWVRKNAQALDYQDKSTFSYMGMPFSLS
ncbi:MAG: hypothetical protein ACLFUE_07745 [Desulfobacteraceae bacterium]